MESSTSPDQVYLGAIQSTYEDLDRWQARAAAPEPPQRGSELAVDDQVFPRHPISEVARTSLMLASEHLRLARDSIDAGQWYPSAHFTVLRSALVGAAQGVWILGSDDRAERRERGLTVLAEIHAKMRAYYRRVQGFTLSDEERRGLREQQKWLTARIEQVAAVRTGAAELNLTDTVIPAALDLVFPDAPRRRDGRALWNLMSADAHVLGWSTATRGQTGSVDRASGLAVTVIGGSPSHVAQPFIASHRLLRAGWSLFDRRCEAP